MLPSGSVRRCQEEGVCSGTTGALRVSTALCWQGAPTHAVRHSDACTDQSQRSWTQSSRRGCRGGSLPPALVGFTPLSSHRNAAVLPYFPTSHGSLVGGTWSFSSHFAKVFTVSLEGRTASLSQGCPQGLPVFTEVADRAFGCLFKHWVLGHLMKSHFQLHPLYVPSCAPRHLTTSFLQMRCVPPLPVSSGPLWPSQKLSAAWYS